ncbi:hypothetical protein [Mucilaginibacter psychrotolerans]|uniref:hypothetical protein n=1 Tax=Mucilaginibacter psychrotolerans TaxID=1524096 RepID=UPI0013052582|nr:hypothetical protein [Mucilaginibacter psychrotolerans]
MTTLTIEISERAGKTITDLVEQLGGKVVATDAESKNGKTKLSRKEKEFLRS